MSGDHEILAQRIERELEELEEIVVRAELAVKNFKELTQYQSAFMDSAALNLHDFYTGLEKIFQQIALKADESLPIGKEWHRELLEQMSLEIPGRRPAFVDASFLPKIQNYLGFRRVVRNVYAFQFQPDRVQQFAADLRPLFVRVSEQLRALMAGFSCPPMKREGMEPQKMKERTRRICASDML